MINALLSVLLLLFSSCTLGIKSIPSNQIEDKYANAADGSKFIVVEGTRVHYRDQGNPQGKPLVLIHGIISSLHTWDGWVKELGKDYRIIRFDLPGFGLSGPLPNDSYTREDYVRFLDAFLTQLKIKNPSLIGNSLGGFVSWNYAATFPHKLNKLVLLDPAGYPFDPPWIVEMAAIPGVGQASQVISPRFIAEWTLKDIYGSSHKPSEETVDRYYEIFLKEGNRQMCARVFLDLLKYRHYQPVEIPTIKNPTFIMWGADDKFIPVAQHQLWQRDLPLAKIKIYPGLGHIPMEENPKLTAQDVREFLSAP